jgi:hypothetical protein
MFCKFAFSTANAGGPTPKGVMVTTPGKLGLRCFICLQVFVDHRPEQAQSGRFVGLVAGALIVAPFKCGSALVSEIRGHIDDVLVVVYPIASFVGHSANRGLNRLVAFWK